MDVGRQTNTETWEDVLKIWINLDYRINIKMARNVKNQDMAAFHTRENKVLSHESHVEPAGWESMALDAGVPGGGRVDRTGGKENGVKSRSSIDLYEGLPTIAHPL